MDFMKQKELPGIAVFLDFEKAFDSIEWDFLQNVYKRLISARSLGTGLVFFIIILPVVF